MPIKKTRRLRVIPTYDKTLKPTPETIKEMEDAEEAEIYAAREARLLKENADAAARLWKIPDTEDEPTSQSVREVSTEEAIKIFSDKFQELSLLCNKTQRTLAAQMLRTTALTEVSRFLNRYAPKQAYIAIQKLFYLCDIDDEWWNTRRDTAVWQWASELVPEYADRWRKVYDTKYGPGK